MQQDLPRNYAADWGRLFLAASVMLYHAKEMQLYESPVFFAGFAVPAFLAISGWYVLQSYERSSSWQHFWIKRAARIFPALTISLFFVYLLGDFAALVDTFKIYIFAGMASTPRGMNGALWSLGAEEVAYMLMVLLSALGFYRSVRPAAVFALCALFLVSALHATKITPAVAQTSALVPAFFTGSACYLAREKISRWWWIAALGGIYGLYLSIPGLKMPNYGFPLNFHPMLSGVLVGAAILLGSYGSKAALPKIPDLSYSIYIYHIPIFMAGKRMQFGFPQTLLILTAICAMSWYFVEQPVLNAAKRWKRGSVGDAPRLAAD